MVGLLEVRRVITSLEEHKKSLNKMGYGPYLNNTKEMMKANEYNVDQFDADVCLPPRKRLLAVLKKQNGSVSGSSCASSSSLSSAWSDFSVHLRDLLSCSPNPCISPDDIVQVSRSAALAAAHVAANVKAEAAAKAASAARNALELVESVSQKTAMYRKNRPTKHVPIELLYKSRQWMDSRKKTDKNKIKRKRFRRLNKGEKRLREGEKDGVSTEATCVADEELARQLHRAMNSSPRISRNSLGFVKVGTEGWSDSDDIKKIYEHQWSKESGFASLIRARVTNEGETCEGNTCTHSPSHGGIADMGNRLSISEVQNFDKMEEKVLLNTDDSCSEQQYQMGKSFDEGEDESIYFMEDWHCKKFAPSQYFTESKSLCILHSNTGVTTGSATVGVDE